jgi:hypothetical protein
MQRSTLLVIAALLTLAWAACSSPTDSSKNTPATDDSLRTVVVQVHDPRQAAPLVYPEVPVGAPTAVREVLVAAAKAYPAFSFTDTTYIGMGHLLTGINGLRNAKGTGAYWQFCIDNVASDRGIDEKEIGPGQTLDWHYAEYGQLPCRKIGE